MRVPVIRLEVYYNDETKQCDCTLTEGNVFNFSRQEYIKLLREALDSLEGTEHGN